MLRCVLTLAPYTSGSVTPGSKMLERREVFILREKFEPGPGFKPWASSLALYHLSYPRSINGTGINISHESNAIQGNCWSCDTIRHHFHQLWK